MDTKVLNAAKHYRKRPSILVCEDDEGILDVITIILSEKGYAVTPLARSEEIYRHIAKDRPDLIFLDLWMPGLSGEDITLALKKDTSTRDIPVIIISANKDTAKIAKRSGADAYLPKPFDIADLEQIVERFIAPRGSLVAA